MPALLGVEAALRGRRREKGVAGAQRVNSASPGLCHGVRPAGLGNSALPGWRISAIFPPMSTLAEIEAAADRLPPAEKLRLMETLWQEFSRRGGAEVASPAWHAEALAETERRLAEGLEEVLDWPRVKEELRQKTV
jgi:hypothetical protein